MISVSFVIVSLHDRPHPSAIVDRRLLSTQSERAPEMRAICSPYTKQKKTCLSIIHCNIEFRIQGQFQFQVLCSIMQFQFQVACSFSFNFKYYAVLRSFSSSFKYYAVSVSSICSFILFKVSFSFSFKFQFQVLCSLSFKYLQFHII